MERQFLAYLFLATLVVGLTIWLVRTRYFSRDRALRRRRLADEARRHSRAQRRVT